jgi:manganese transport protein
MAYSGSISIKFLDIITVYRFKAVCKKSKIAIQNHSPHNLKLKFSKSESYTKKDIAVSVDFSSADEIALNSAIELGGKAANYTLIHVVETVGAMIYGRILMIMKHQSMKNYWKNTK